MAHLPSSEIAGRSRRRLLVIHNAGAGVADTRLLTDVMARLAAHGVAASAVSAARPSEVDDRMRAFGDVDALVAAGGDGTLRALAAFVASSRRPDLPIGLIPLGTGNVMAREIGLVFSPDAIATTLVHGPAIPIRAGLANDTIFLAMAGAGIDAAIVHRLAQRLKRRVGRAAYAGPTLRTLTEPLPKLTATIDGTDHPCAWVIATRSRLYGGGFLLAPDAGLRREQLVAVVFQPRHRRDLVRQMMALAAGRLEGAAGVQHLPCRTMTVVADPPARTQIDGDAFEITPFTLSAAGPSIQLLAPPTYAAEAVGRG
jgi:diacylglycerol kinase family enzyme